MTASYNIAVITGSLRKEAFSRRLAMAAIKLAPGHKFDVVPIGDLPLFNQDLEQTPPAPWTTFRDRVRPADAVLFVTPEYNRSMPGVLKNAIDVGSRPYGQSVWNGKPGAVIGTSPGAMGGFGANHHLRQSLTFLNVPVLQQPEAYLGRIGGAFDDHGELTDESVRKFLTGFMEAFIAWIGQQKK
ncbi:MAG: NAD(P)H-dependent oxidoreductase [Xanthobacteraceae bacterium]|nr:MAG: NAD(P)H-dependent oxidoreductase [Xanthobacteraceae bacterium]